MEEFHWFNSSTTSFGENVIDLLEKTVTEYLEKNYRLDRVTNLMSEKI